MSYTRSHFKKEINLVWLGGKLLGPHMVRMEVWKILNPDYDVTVWVDAEYQETVQQQLHNRKTMVKSIASLTLSENLQTLIKRVTAEREDKLFPNYEAASNVYCFEILKNGGWYVSTDVVPETLNEEMLRNDLEIVFNGSYDDEAGIVNNVAPNVIGVNANNLIVMIALELLEAIASRVTEGHIKLIRSSQASQRLLATHSSTGFVLRGALGKIKLDDYSLLEVLNDKDGQSFHPDLFKTIIKDFYNKFEYFWIFEKLIKDNKVAVALPGISVDKHFGEIIEEKAEINWGLISPIASLIDEIYKNTPVKTWQPPALITSSDSPLSQSFFRSIVSSIATTDGETDKEESDFYNPSILAKFE